MTEYRLVRKNMKKSGDTLDIPDDAQNINVFESDGPYHEVTYLVPAEEDEDEQQELPPIEGVEPDDVIGYNDGVFSYHEFNMGWDSFNAFSDTNPDVMYISDDMVRYMVTDEQLSDLFISERTILKHVHVERPMKRIDELNERLPENGVGEMYGMAVIETDVLGHHEAMLTDGETYVKIQA